MKKDYLRRREFLQAAGLGAASTLLGCKVAETITSESMKTFPSPHSPSNSNKPNILFIMTDQHRADLMTCAGRDLVPTPNIDLIASRGVRFTNAYCPYPVCVASRMALLTGLYSHSTGAITNTNQLDWRYRTMAHHFAENGYLTALIGKMHFANAHNHGFEYYMSINDWLMYLGPKVQHYANEIANHPLGQHFFKTVDDSGAGLPDIDGLWPKGSPWVGNVEKYNFDSMASKLDAEDHLDMFIAREAAKFIARYRRQPFFLLTSFMKPHSPFYPPRQWAEKYPIDKMKLQNMRAQGQKRQRAHRAGYLGNLAFVDTCVGYVYRTLEKEGLLDNTIVIYTSDHGEMDGDHGLYQKFCLFEPSVKVPLIISYPNHLPQNKVTTALTEYFGLYPTLVDLTGLKQPEKTTLLDIPHAPEKMDATSFVHILRKPDIKGPSAAFSEYNLRNKTCEYMVRTRQYKYIFNHGSTHELYDHEADPGEFINRINDPNLKKVRNRLHDQLFAWYNPQNNPYRPA
jgi:choline-sulfatase